MFIHIGKIGCLLYKFLDMGNICMVEGCSFEPREGQYHKTIMILDYFRLSKSSIQNFKALEIVMKHTLPKFQIEVSIIHRGKGSGSRRIIQPLPRAGR